MHIWAASALFAGKWNKPKTENIKEARGRGLLWGLTQLQYWVKMDECHVGTFAPTYAACEMDYKMLNTDVVVFFFFFLCNVLNVGTLFLLCGCVSCIYLQQVCSLAAYFYDNRTLNWWCSYSKIYYGSPFRWVQHTWCRSSSSPILCNSILTAWRSLNISHLSC